MSANTPDPATAQNRSDASDSADGKELERSLGLIPALSVGMGTMIGAGIFVFPGLAVGEAGPAAVLSFALGAAVAVCVALPTSELATAMPESGGGYYFVSRGLGGLWGALVGLGQWTGLVFASGFYLAGAGQYLARMAQALGWGSSIPGTWIGFAAAVLLTVTNLVGTRKAGRVQSFILSVLLTILLLFLAYGGMTVLGVTGAPAGSSGPFLPYGTLPVLAVGAMVFTSYLGFAQIAAVAGEIKEPSRNVPRAILGSVLVVGALYIATVYLASRFFSPERMGEMGETAMVEVARALAGDPGAAVFLLGGVLATLSSANASILSSSRSVFALGRDGLVPDGASAVNERFRTPHVAILAAGVPTAVLALIGRIDILAEVASLLHLVLYGLVCFALIALRRRNPDSYQPAFRSPGYPWIPLLGGVASFGLILFMEPLSQILGGGVLAATVLWYWLYAPDVDLKKNDRIQPSNEEE